MRRLSKCKFDHGFAYCSMCSEWFVDDLSVFGSIFCPNKCGRALDRGFPSPDLQSKEKYEQFKKVVESWPSPFRFAK